MKIKMACFLLPLLWLSAPSGAGQEKDIEKQYQEATEKLVCQCHCLDQLSVCAMQNCSSATPMRAEIREKLQAGMGVDEVVEMFVARVGKHVLAAPTMKGFDLTAWIIPFLLLGLGLVVVGWIAVKMARPTKIAEQTAAVALDPRVEAELKDFEEES